VEINLRRCRVAEKAITWRSNERMSK
jgi:hypothetical protein